jgi:hypothetical protein
MIAQKVALQRPKNLTSLMLVCTRAQSWWWSRIPSFSVLTNFVYRYILKFLSCIHVL